MIEYTKNLSKLGEMVLNVNDLQTDILYGDIRLIDFFYLSL